MAIPFFFEENLNDQNSFTLTEETSRHIIQVLRMHAGEQVRITNGKGQTLLAELVSENKKAVEGRRLSTSNIANPDSSIIIAISLIKNTTRFEWFLEKATEIGISQIIPMICARTEKQNYRYDRMKNILVSAMLQSRQAWLPVLQEPTKFEDVIAGNYQQKFIAHCIDQNKQAFNHKTLSQSADKIILIGPEGDFTNTEIESAIRNNFIPVSLSETILRTETAGVVACVLLNQQDEK
ncbi:MAG: 16S rRNA (uracil(1498)-N(3))-methyltransferase [Chitinophagaceae bacterium]|nr:16S rRNA (uracil(1498)-N(3))-methyltransferase [Chitinophagaceae bacterium]